MEKDKEGKSTSEKSSKSPVASEKANSDIESSGDGSTVAESTVVDSAVVDSTVVDSTVVDSTVVDSTVVDSTTVDSATVDSAIEDSAKEDSIEKDASATNSNVPGSADLQSDSGGAFSKNVTTVKPASKNTHSKPNNSKSSRDKPADSLSGGAGRWPRIFAFSMVVIVIAGIATVWWLLELQKQQLENTQAQVTATSNLLNKQTKFTNALKLELNSTNDVSRNSQQETTRLQQQALAKYQKTVQQQLQSLQLQISDQQQRLASMSTTDRADWLLAEAEYLMHLADQRLLIGKDVGGAVDLLTAADNIIRDLDDSALYPVRQALAESISELNAATNTDIEGVYFRIQALAKRADQLRLFDLPEFKFEKPEIEQDDDWQQRLLVGIDGALKKLSNYIRFRKRDEIYVPLLSPENESAVRQSLHLMFEQAQMALLSRKQKLYEQSLQKASSWLNSYYKIDESSVSSVNLTINSLLKEKIEIDLPNVSAAPKALKNYLEFIHQLPDSNSGIAEDLQE